MNFGSGKAKCWGVILALAIVAGSVRAQLLRPQNSPGKGNRRAAENAPKSQMVRSSMDLLVGRVKKIKDPVLRGSTLDIADNAQTCIKHRADLSEREKDAVLAALNASGLLDAHDRDRFPGGWKAGVFPPVLEEGTSCPQLPQPFFAAPGGVFGAHHSFPGGLAVHEANNQTAALNLLEEYRQMYGVPPAGPPMAEASGNSSTEIAINEDWLRAAPVWHDWAKTVVFQWNDDGAEFAEMNIGGNGVSDNYGLVGDSRTGAHHILSLAESISRGLPPGFVITQACAHSSPSEGAEYKVVNWLRAAAIISRADPLKQGYLVIDEKRHLRLPPLRKLGSINLVSSGEVNLLPEYVLHNLSDSDHPFSMAAGSSIEIILRDLARDFGFNASNWARYNNEFRNPVLSFFSADRLFIIYTESGREGVKMELEKAHQQSAF
jgi:hypothetical protein